MGNHSWETNGTTFEVKQISHTHRRVIVTTKRGNVYACTWAGGYSDPCLTREEVESAWQNDRRSFTRFNTSEGCYV